MAIKHKDRHLKKAGCLKYECYHQDEQAGTNSKAYNNNNSSSQKYQIRSLNW